MRSFAAILLISVTSALAYQVTAPGDTQGWTTSGPNYLTWVRVDTDPLNFTAVLTNQNQAVMPQGPQVLNALVDGTAGQIVCNPPSGGWPQGSGFRVNLAADAQHLDTLLAQSNQFSILTPNSSTSSTTQTGTSGTTSFLTASVTPTTPAASTTSSDTSTTPTSKSAAVIGMKVETGFLTAVAALAAFITTHF